MLKLILKQYQSVYLEIYNAFERVWHGRLNYKLKRCSVSGDLLLKQSFPKDRKQRMLLNGQNSLWGDVLAGAPQGSILGPLFYFAYINDQAPGVKCSVKRFTVISRCSILLNCSTFLTF